MSEEAKKYLIDDAEMDEILGEISGGSEAESGSDHASRMLEASVVPINKPVRRGRGRPPKVVSQTSSQAEFNQALLEQEIAFVDKDEVVKAIIRGEDSLRTMHILKERIARSAATLDFIRIQNQKLGKNSREIPQIVSRQISALKEIANIELEIRKLGVDHVDLNNPLLQKVFKLLIDKFRDVASSVLSSEQFDLVWNKLETELEGWEEEADGIVR